MNWQGKRYWLVGASEGLGRALAHQISRAGAEVIVSARNADRLAALVAELPGPARAVAVDVASTDSVRAAAAEVGEIDGVVWLAGVYWPMRAQDWDADKVEQMIDINLTGAARVLGQVVPGMVARGRGHVVLTGSLAGFRGLPGAIGYGASKAGVMALAESMRADLGRSGVLVQLANPGFIRTRLTDMNDFQMPFLMEPDEAARHMFAQMNRISFAANFPRVFAAMFRLGQFLPDWMYYRLFR
ncbi:short-chain dehydrogenase [Rhodobacter veldkampii DSM 11550]|uniref:Short-chain dehydrogenase n=1 Tax=Phaeovulum veldkampii DSM 11550 TaxID=1185920 RepID=A0A2T4JLK9_9RHOB|nr:SDR family NAD(P)-dependent oxidoreductase [Phaeovulum veldkampii]MBK5946520.1 short-chain dehydrogenase [Phaeovulum veldkampii DSM 11550]PTE18785.1 short-chain dehydrogenase [Phaeovulum veldkampii DSM 11550]TDQ59999.1 NADP-dependent 3-hydroxy acid dehydrogenase YdfG [Phaeovulum veldkampii DSM 11550]